MADARFGSILIDIRGDTARIDRSMRNMERNMSQSFRRGEQSMRRMDRSMQSINRSAQTLTRSLRLVSGALAAMGGIVGIRGLVRANSEFISMRTTLETLTGSAEMARSEMSRLMDFAATTPFTLQQSIEGYQRLVALGLDPSEEAMRSFGNTASAMGRDMIQFIEAVAAASTFQFQRLQQFGIIARTVGDNIQFTFQGVTTEVERNSQAIVGYLRSIGETQFAGAMERQMDTLPGKLSNLQDSFFRVATAIGEGGFSDAIGRAAERLADFNARFIESGNAERIGKVLGGAFDFASEKASFFVERIGPAIEETLDDIREGFKRVSDEMNINFSVMEVVIESWSRFFRLINIGIKSLGELAGTAAGLMSILNAESPLTQHFGADTPDSPDRQTIVTPGGNVIQFGGRQPQPRQPASAAVSQFMREQLKQFEGLNEQIMELLTTPITETVDFQPRLRIERPDIQTDGVSPLQLPTGGEDGTDPTETIERDLNRFHRLLERLNEARQEALQSIQLRGMDDLEQRIARERIAVERRLNDLQNEAQEIISNDKLTARERELIENNLATARRTILDDYFQEITEMSREHAERMAEAERQALSETLRWRQTALDAIDASGRASFETRVQLIEMEAERMAQAIGDELLAHQFKIAEIERMERQLSEDMLRWRQRALETIDDRSRESFQNRVRLLEMEAREIEERTGDAALAAQFLAAEMDELGRRQALVFGGMAEGFAVWRADMEDNMTSLAESTFTMMQDIERAFERSLGDAFFNIMMGRFDRLRDVAVSALEAIARAMANMLAEQAAQGILRAFIPNFGDFGGAREKGGPIEAGKTYLVGERGPELVTFDHPGVVIPNRESMAMIDQMARQPMPNIQPPPMRIMGNDGVSIQPPRLPDIQPLDIPIRFTEPRLPSFDGINISSRINDPIVPRLPDFQAIEIGAQFSTLEPPKIPELADEKFTPNLSHTRAAIPAVEQFSRERSEQRQETTQKVLQMINPVFMNQEEFEATLRSASIQGWLEDYEADGPTRSAVREGL